MDLSHLTPYINSIMAGLLIIIGWFLNRIAKQYDEAQKNNAKQYEEAQKNYNEQFNKLLKKFDTLTEIIYEHKTDVEVIKTQINAYNKDLTAVNTLFDRVREVENDVSILKDRSTH